MTLTERSRKEISINQMNSKSVIGLDFGSDSLRALLVDAADGSELASCTCNYKRWSDGLYCDASQSSFRQHPLDYLDSMKKVIRGVLKNHDPFDVAGIGIDTTGSTPCAVDRNGTPLALLPEFSDNPNAMFILWKDHTALKEAAEINACAKSWGGENYTKYSGGIYSSEWFWSKILHSARVDDKVRDAAFSWVEHCDWIPAILTGNTNPLTMKRSRCAAGHKAMWHSSWGGLPPEGFLAGIDPLLSGIRERLYDNTFTCDVKAGHISKEWALKLGLHEKVVIGTGAFDCHMGALGANIDEAHLVKVFGTSTCDIMVASNIDNCIRGICGQVDGSVIPGMTGLEAGQSAFGDIYAWFKRFLSWETKSENVLERLSNEAEKIPPGSNDLLAIDWHNGRRSPDANQHLTGAILGLTLGASAPMVFRALVESTAFGSRRIIERFSKEGVKIKGVNAVGGIAVKSPFVMQICADVMGMPIRLMKSEQACALGAAVSAAVAAKLYPDIKTAMSKMASRIGKIYLPNHGNAAAYEKLYLKYCRYADTLEKEIMRDVQ